MAEAAKIPEASTTALEGSSRPQLRTHGHSFLAAQRGITPPFPPEAKKETKATPFMYFLIRLLFKFVLKVFYATVVVEGQSYIPPSGYPCIIVANHGNSLTDPLILVTSISLRKRTFLRLTAKDTLFGKKTFTSWLIESVGTLPIQRHKEHQNTPGGPNNTVVTEKLVQAVGEGDAICLFPEGGSRYHPSINTFKTGTARIVSDVLSRNRDDPNFELTLLTCSITYTGREKFRSDVLVSFNPPFKLRQKDHAALIGSDTTPPDFGAIRALTEAMGEQIRQGTLDAPDWDYVELAHTARRLYAPFGTRMGLGDHIRLTQAFIDVFAKGEARRFAESKLRAGLQGSSVVPRADAGSDAESDNENSVYRDKDGVEFSVKRVFTSPPPTGTAPLGEHTSFPLGEGEASQTSEEEEDDLKDLAVALRAYDAKLKKYGIKDERVRQSDRLTRIVIVKRLCVRVAGLLFLGTIAAPGMLLWQPVFGATEWAVKRVKKGGKWWDTWDDIAHTKLVVGLGAFVMTWLVVVLITLPISFLTLPLLPLFMWASLRWWEDAASCARAAIALTNLLVWVGKPELGRLRTQRELLRLRVVKVATGRRMGLPLDAEKHFATAEQGQKWEKGRMQPGWWGRTSYLSLRRRRKKSWEEVLRVFPGASYPHDS